MTCTHPTDVLNATTRFQVGWITANRHVGTTPRELIAHFWHRLPAEQRGHATRAIRHAAYRHALRCHDEARELYRALMTGTL